MNIRKNLARLAGLGAATTAAIGLLSTGAAHADTFIPLPGGEITKTMPNGVNVTVRLVGESAKISPSMGATPLHRNTWVSGSAQVEFSGPGAENTRAAIAPGYIVGCQVNIAGGGAGGKVGGNSSWDGAKTSASSGASGNLTLGPGQTAKHMILDREKPNPYGEESHGRSNKFMGESGSVTWTDTTIAVNGCAGYAQARSFVMVKVRGDFGVSAMTLWGQPFSLG